MHDRLCLLRNQDVFNIKRGDILLIQIAVGSLHMFSVARGSFQNLFPTKDAVLMELVGTMFDGQFGVARSIAGEDLPPVYSYAVETAIQLTLTELNENLREIYIEAYSLPTIAEYIYINTTAELKRIFGANFPDYTDSDFYETEIGTAGLMRNYMAQKPPEIRAIKARTGLPEPPEKTARTASALQKRKSTQTASRFSPTPTATPSM